MSEEFKLTGELAELESQLRGLSPTESRIDHDELLYRAGWEAALAQAAKVQTKRRPSTSQLLAATFATISAALALMLMQPTDIDSVIPEQSQASLAHAPTNPEPDQIAQANDSSQQQVELPPTATAENNRWKALRNRRLLPGRRDPERWLRATDRMTLTSSTTVVKTPTMTLREWYLDFPSDGQLLNRTQPTGEPL